MNGINSRIVKVLWIRNPESAICHPILSQTLRWRTVPIPTANGSSGPVEVVSVAIGQWAVVEAPTQIRTLLGSCVGVVLYDRVARLGGLAHVVLPSARGAVDHPGKYADTAIPTVIADFERRLGTRARPRLVAKLAGGASMFQVSPDADSSLNIGQRNQEAIERILAELRIPVLARDLGGTSGRRLTLDTASGMVAIRVPGGDDYSI
jgi:chemotaxis protein CheD